MATDYTIPKDEYRALMAERDKLLDGFHAMQQLYEDELKHALAENTKLRAERDHMWALRDIWQENDAKLREENERLRSVVSDGADNARELRAENAKLRELVGHYDSALGRMCDQTQGFYSQSDWYSCDECVLGKGHGFDKCGINELQEEAHELRIEVGE